MAFDDPIDPSSTDATPPVTIDATGLADPNAGETVGQRAARVAAAAETARRAYDPTTQIGAAPTIAPLPDSDSSSIGGRFGPPAAGDTGFGEYQDELRQHDASQQRVAAYYNLAHGLAAQHEETANRADAADWLAGSAKLNPSSPTYEDDVSKLYAQFPGAAHDQAVQDLHAIKDKTRGVYLQHQAAGGAAQFDGLAKDAYVDYLKKNPTDFAGAQARGKNIETAASQGLLNADDPKALNPDNSHNFDYLASSAVDAQGKAAAQARTNKLNAPEYNQAKELNRATAAEIKQVQTNDDPQKPGDKGYDHLQQLFALQKHSTDVMAKFLLPPSGATTAAAGATGGGATGGAAPFLKGLGSTPPSTPAAAKPAVVVPPPTATLSRPNSLPAAQ